MSIAYTKVAYSRCAPIYGECLSNGQLKFVDDATVYGAVCLGGRLADAKGNRSEHLQNGSLGTLSHN